MFDINELLDISLYDDYSSFCSNQCNCVLCELSNKELIYNDYQQPCEEVYNLLKIIQELSMNKGVK